MIKNGKDIANGTVLSTQVCVIGSGPAGITAAWQLQKAGIKVILIEGSRRYDMLDKSWPDKDLLYNGKAEGLFKTNEPKFLIQPYTRHQPNPAWERERFYGGTSAHWGGQCRPQDPIDLEARPGVGDFPGFPGWPLTRDKLNPYYAQASALCHLNGNYGQNGDNFTNKYWADVLKTQVPVLDGFEVEMYQFVGPDYRNFATRKFDGGITIAESDVEVILNASLLDIDHQQGSVSSLRVASMDTSIPPKKATEFTINADVYVLACGAVANARQLLLSKAGNEHDQVGRYFMCHPLSQSQAISAWSYLNPSQSNFMEGHTSTGQWTDSNHVTANARFIPNPRRTKDCGIGRCWFWAGGGQYYFEMTPNPDSRITLCDTKDTVFDQRQTHIEWHLSPQDEYTYNETTNLFQTAVTDLGGGVSFDTWEEVKSQLIVNGHHIGTTRMSDKPETGVVDPNLKVHSLNNLYVAGASVFPTAGISNPTFTIIMFSIRLADHLKKVLGRAS
ncbi:MAG TPA: GMC family oxidoreductase [Blastocatellia bacterium]|nr:GMC family oxidoreductase [Blastocatellia bacterium]